MDIMHEKFHQLKILLNYSRFPVKHVVNVTVLMFLIQSCNSNDDDDFLKPPEPCSEYQRTIIEKCQEGDYKPVVEYLIAGGDPMLECHVAYYSAIDNYAVDLRHCIRFSDNKELIKYYVTTGITQDVKDDFFLYFVYERDKELTKYLMKVGGRFPTILMCPMSAESCIEDLMFAKDLGYDLNWQHPEDGQTLFMQYASLPSEEDQDAHIELLKYLISNGADVNKKNFDGKTAFDLVENQKIKRYLQSLKVN